MLPRPLPLPVQMRPQEDICPMLREEERCLDGVLAKGNESIHELPNCEEAVRARSTPGRESLAPTDEQMKNTLVKLLEMMDANPDGFPQLVQELTASNSNAASSSGLGKLYQLFVCARLTVLIGCGKARSARSSRSRAWTNDEYIASSKDTRERFDIERMSKIGLHGGPLHRRCEASGCDKFGHRDVEKMQCSGCKLVSTVRPSITASSSHPSPCLCCILRIRVSDGRLEKTQGGV